MILMYSYNTGRHTTAEVRVVGTDGRGACHRRRVSARRGVAGVRAESRRPPAT